MGKVFQNIKNKTDFHSPKNWSRIKTIDMHTGGEPLRVIVDGFPELKGNSVLEYRQYCKNNYDPLRTALMFEPRGHADMYGCLLTPPNDDDGDFGVVFLHNEGYSTMCGHAIIALSTLAVEMGWIDVHEGDNLLKIDAPCGRITAFAHVHQCKISGVRFHCVPSFVVGLDKIVEVKGLGEVTYDLAYGGAFYAYVDMAKNPFDFDLTPDSYRALISAGMNVKNAVMQQDADIKHPFEEDLSFLYGTIFIGKPVSTGDSGQIDDVGRFDETSSICENAHNGETSSIAKPTSPNIRSRNVCIFAEGEVDRCPTGSGISGRMAIHRTRNEIGIGEIMAIESITGSIFKASVISEEDYGPFKAVIPQVEGQAYITGMHTFVIDPNDPMKEGFILR